MDLKQRKFAIGYLAISPHRDCRHFSSRSLAPRATNVSYSEFKALVKKGKVANLTLDKETISGTLSTDGLEGLLPKESVEELKRLGAERTASSRRASRIPGWWPSSSRRT